MKNNKYIKHIIILVVLSYFCFMFGNGLLSLTIPDEVFYAQTAKEMARQHSWMTPYLFAQPQFEKPVFLYWLLRLGFIIFGINSFAARFFPALFGMIGVIAIYLFGRIGFKDPKKAFISAIVLMTGGLYIGLARTVFTDLIFSVFILLSLLSFYWGYAFKNKKGPGILLFFVFAALATLTKGPLGLLIPFLSVILFLFIKKDLKFLLNQYLFWGLLLFGLISLPWYILMFKLYGNTFVNEFFYNDHLRRIIEAEHPGNDTWYFYPLSMAGCIFPWSIFLVFSLFSLPQYLKQRDNQFLVFLVCWIVSVFVIFQSAHSKLASYIFPLFAALALFMGNFIVDLITQDKKRLIYFILSLNLLTVFLIPASLIIISIWFKHYLSLHLLAQPVVNFIIFIFLAFGLGLSFLIARKKILKSVYCLALFVPIMVYLIPFVRHNIEPYLSPKESCQYLLKNYQVDNVILSSKFFARGVKYYADKEVAVIDIPGTPFFSQHLIPFLNSKEKVLNFLRKQKVTYCVLKNSSVRDIGRIVSGEFKYTVLKVIGNEYILKIETL
ncbi:MAG: glycosyltransferase family 39 protein [Candidatus Omnitrophica bacterium]|nr:glycosyltransferase family 39 protein [Candidatus Omnitrophota bacterium]